MAEYSDWNRFLSVIKKDCFSGKQKRSQKLIAPSSVPLILAFFLSSLAPFRRHACLLHCTVHAELFVFSSDKITKVIVTMSFRGVPVSSAEAKQRQERDLAKLRVPKIYREAVDMTKVNRPIIKRWITTKLNELLPDDDIITDYTLELLGGDKPDIREIQLNLNGFLEENTAKFCKELWELLVAAQKDKDGIPPQLIAIKKEQMEQERVKREIKIESWSGGGGGGRDRGDRRERNDRRDAKGRNRRDGDRRNGDRRDRDRDRDRDDRSSRSSRYNRSRSRSPTVKKETDEYGRDRKD